MFPARGRASCDRLLQRRQAFDEDRQMVTAYVQVGISAFPKGCERFRRLKADLSDALYARQDRDRGSHEDRTCLRRSDEITHEVRTASAGNRRRVNRKGRPALNESSPLRSN